MSKFFNIGIVQVASTSMNPDVEARKKDHLSVMSFYIDQICMLNPTIDLIVFPELYLNGCDPLNWNQLAETIPGPATDFLCKKAVQYKKWLIPGSMIENREGVEGTLNTSVLISPEGEIVLKYSKVFIPYPLEPSTPGFDFPVYEIPNVGKIGIMICADGHTPEIGRNLALNGAEIIIKPTFQGFWIGGLRNHVPICQTRAVENQCFIVSVNQAAPMGMGHSCVCDPEGRVIEELGSTESFFMVSLNLDEVKRARENGFLGMFPFLKLLRDFKEAGRPVDQCYLKGLENAPVFQTLKGKAPIVPNEVKRFGEE